MIVYITVDMYSHTALIKDAIITTCSMAIQETSKDEITDDLALHYINMKYGPRAGLYRCIEEFRNNFKGIKKFALKKCEIIIWMDFIYDANSKDIIRYRYNIDSKRLDRYRAIGDDQTRFEMSDLNTTQYIYPVGAKIVFSDPRYDEYTTGIIIENSVNVLNHELYSNLYMVEVDNDINLEIHYDDISYCDQEPILYNKACKNNV